MTVFYKGVNVLCNSLRMVNIYLCLLLGILHTNNCKNEFNDTCIHLTVNLLIRVKMFTYLFELGKKEMPPNTSPEKCSVIVTIINILKRNPKKDTSL